MSEQKYQSPIFSEMNISQIMIESTSEIQINSLSNTTESSQNSKQSDSNVKDDQKVSYQYSSTNSDIDSDNLSNSSKRQHKLRPSSLQIKSIKNQFMSEQEIGKLVQQKTIEFTVSSNQSENQNSQLSKYNFLQKIEEGGHGTVWKVQNIFTKQIYAAKKIIADNEEMKKIVEKEYYMLSKLDHPLIIKPIELIYDEQKLTYFIIQEYFEGESFFNLLKMNKNRSFKIDDIQIKLIVKQLLSVISYIHSQNLIHKDITIMNVLYNENTGDLKLIDFGIAQEIIQSIDNFENQNLFISPICNKLFWPIEVLADIECNEKIDEFGVGMIMLSLLSNKIITYMRLKKLKKQVSNSNVMNLYKLAYKLVENDPHTRISAKQALQQLIQI